MDREAKCLSTRGTSLGPQEEGISTQAMMPTSLEDALDSEMTAAAHTQGALTHGGPRSQTQTGWGSGAGEPALHGDRAAGWEARKALQVGEVVLVERRDGAKCP